MWKKEIITEVKKSMEEPPEVASQPLNDLLVCQDFIEAVAPFLRRLQKPRYDEYETDEYVNGSTDCERALKAMADWDAAH